MTVSMTGFGRSQQSINQRTITVELKSVNHRFFEFNARTPRGCSFMEDRLKSLAQQSIFRGKVDLYLSIQSDSASDLAVRANISLAKSYLLAIKEIEEATNIKNDISMSALVRFSDIFSVEKLSPDEESLWEDVAVVANEAIISFCNMRRREGEKLENDLTSRLANLLTLIQKVEECSVQTALDYREKLYQRINEVLGDRSIDDSRVLTEVAIFAERIAVDEETVRLKSHLDQFCEILKEPVPVGRKLDFLTQEINRETNTIGSKAQSPTIVKVVIDMKSEIEKIREQIQNLE